MYSGFVAMCAQGIDVAENNQRVQHKTRPLQQRYLRLLSRLVRPANVRERIDPHFCVYQQGHTLDDGGHVPERLAVQDAVNVFAQLLFAEGVDNHLFGVIDVDVAVEQQFVQDGQLFFGAVRTHVVYKFRFFHTEKGFQFRAELHRHC